MKSRILQALGLLLLSALQGCAIIGGIFKAGAYTGAIIVILMIGLVVFVIARLAKK